MAYYRRRYRSWRSRGWRGSSGPSKYDVLLRLFGEAIILIRASFLKLDEEAIDELLSDYGEIHGEAAEKYARNTYPKWRSGATNLSGQTMQRLVELVPPYLSAEQRFEILKIVLKQHEKKKSQRVIRINIKEPQQGFSDLKEALASISSEDVLAHLPPNVMDAAKWLYDDDITSARAMLADAERLENDIVRTSAAREVDLLQRTIASGQVKSASYSVKTPSGTLNVVAYTPSLCFVASRCFGAEGHETHALRVWRDKYLLEREWGRRFTVWYYKNGEQLAISISKFPPLLILVKIILRVFCVVVGQNKWGKI